MSGAAKTVFIGLDGATFTVLDGLMQAGVMPALAELTARGVRGTLYSTPHPLTPPAWTSLMTGRSPGSHGVFDFVQVSSQADPPGYSLTTSADNHCETIWSIASRSGHRVTTLNFPCMFPPPALNGFVVPGFVPWTYLPRAIHPRDLYPRLRAQPAFNARELAIDWDTERKALQGLPEAEFDHWIRFHTAREQQWFEMVHLLMREEPCELTAVLFDGVDKLQHLCFHLLHPGLAKEALTPSLRQAREACLAYFRQLDDYIGRIVAMAGPEARCFLASDHGFTAAGDRIFYANVWLEQNGYLAWREGVPLDDGARLTLEGFTETGSLLDWSATTAFALTASSNGIYIRQAKGPGEPGVPPEEYGAFRDRLVAGLLELRDPATGLPVVERVLTREAAFAGERMDRAPDLTLALRDHSFLSVLRADAPLKPRHMPYGTHHPEGVFFASGPGIRAGAELAPLSILQVAPTLLYSLGLPIPADMEAAPALEAFEAGQVAARPPRFAAADFAPAPSTNGANGADGAGLTADAEAQVLEQLKALGYLE